MALIIYNLLQNQVGHYQVETLKSTFQHSAPMANNDNNSDWVLTLVNGIIAGAGAAVAVMSFMLTRFVGLYEGIMGVSTIEVRAGILLGAVVAAAAIGYEVYRKKPVKTQQGIS